MMREFKANQQLFRLGSRKSELALWQTGYVGDLLAATWPELVVAVETLSTKGDQILDAPLPLIGGKGLFTAELEAALHSGAIDAAVHSLKDLPVEDPVGLAVGAIPARANPGDVLVSRQGYSLESLPPGAVVGTSSRRRAAQLLRLRPDLRLADLRGNVPTRIGKAHDPDGPYDAIILAYAGLERLGLLEVISQEIPLAQMLPAPGQGALGVQCRAEATSLELLAPLDDAATRMAVTAERAFLAGLGGGCAVPIAAYATVQGENLELTGRVLSADGSQFIDIQAQGLAQGARQLGLEMAQEALDSGAAMILAELT